MQDLPNKNKYIEDLSKREIRQVGSDVRKHLKETGAKIVYIRDDQNRPFGVVVLTKAVLRNPDGTKSLSKGQIAMGWSLCNTKEDVFSKDEAVVRAMVRLENQPQILSVRAFQSNHTFNQILLSYLFLALVGPIPSLKANGAHNPLSSVARALVSFIKHIRNLGDK